MFWYHEYIDVLIIGIVEFEEPENPKSTKALMGTYYIASYS